jgi:conjugative relaxase-like TrwC/TraI family protein
MLRVTTLYASSAAATAAYYTEYLTNAPGEEPGVWSGAQAAELGLSGTVRANDLQGVLEGRDPKTGTPLGSVLRDRVLSDGRVVRAVAGFDATFSAPKSLSVWWALTGDRGLLDAHDVAVRAALEHLERFGATTRIRVDGHRLHPDTGGLTMATFRQTTSRADDPQVHTHAVISAKVRTEDGRWWALDARYVKRNQRMLGGLYQSVLRAELTHRYGVEWGPIVNGQAELAGIPSELLAVFSKRAAQVDAALDAKVADFRFREGRDPTGWERAALCREAAADTRTHKSGHGAGELQASWQAEASAVGWTAERFTAGLSGASRDRVEKPPATVEAVLDGLSTVGSTWTRADVLRAICDRQAPIAGFDGRRWAAALDRACDQVLSVCADLDPPDATSRRRGSDGRAVWLEPITPHLTSDAILAEEEAVLVWAMDAQTDEAAPSTTVDRDGLDVLQADAAAAVAGDDRLVLVVGPAGTGKTTTLARAVQDLDDWGRPVFGVAPTAKAARVLAGETGLETATVAKLLHEWTRTDRDPLDGYRLAAGTTLIVDEAGMIGTGSLHQLVRLAERERWRLVLVGDPHQLQAVGRGGLFAELCTTGRTVELTRVHRFQHPWEADASLRLRAGDPHALDAYQTHGRITPGAFDQHVASIASRWVTLTGLGRSVAVTASTNDHVDALNAAVQHLRHTLGYLHPCGVPIGGGEQAHPGDVVVTRRNDHQLQTTSGEPVRNRDRWTVTATCADGSLTVSDSAGHGTVTVPADYARQHVRLGYAATEHGHQGDTVDVALALVSPATTHRGLYVAVTRGRHTNQLHVITAHDDPTEARTVLDTVMTNDRADVPATTRRRDLASQQPPVEPAPTVDRDDPVPVWLTDYRNRLVDQRDRLEHSLQTGGQRRTEAAAALVDLQPVLAAARVAWAPYAQRIADLDRALDRELRPAMWDANHAALHARFGHRHAAHRHARDATAAVQLTTAQITAIQADGAPIKQQLDTLQEQARTLHAIVDQTFTRHLDQLDRQQLADIDRVIDAIDVWSNWVRGQPVTTNALAAAVDDLHQHVRNTPLLPSEPNVDRTHWIELLEPAVEVLLDRGLDVHGRETSSIDHDFDVGIEL